jgi:hypothetical protein
MTIAQTGKYDIIQEVLRGSSGASFLRVVYRHANGRPNPKEPKSSMQERSQEVGSR